MRMDYAREVLRNLSYFWKRPVGIQTMIDDRKSIIRFDGQDFSEVKLDK